MRISISRSRIRNSPILRGFIRHPAKGLQNADRGTRLLLQITIRDFNSYSPVSDR